jgi:hypothetical protein
VVVWKSKTTPCYEVSRNLLLLLRSCYRNPIHPSGHFGVPSPSIHSDNKWHPLVLRHAHIPTGEPTHHQSYKESQYPPTPAIRTVRLGLYNRGCHLIDGQAEPPSPVPPVISPAATGLCDRDCGPKDHSRHQQIPDEQRPQLCHSYDSRPHSTNLECRKPPVTQ